MVAVTRSALLSVQFGASTFGEVTTFKRVSLLCGPGWGAIYRALAERGSVCEN
jgi:hypothetical protein